MKRLLQYTGAALGLLLLALVVFFFWGSSGRLSPDERARVRTYTGDPQTHRPDTLTVMTYNIGYLSGMTNNRAVERSKALFLENMRQALGLVGSASPDVLAVQEIDYGGDRVAHIHQLDTLATRLNFPQAGQAVNWDERYLPFPYGWPAVHFGRTISGQSVLSRFPIHDHLRTVLPRPPQPFFREAFYLDRLAQVVLLDLGGRAWGLVNLHLEAFHRSTREKQAQIVADLYSQLRRAGLPVLVLGDLNSTLRTPHSGPPESSTDSASADQTMQTLLGETNLQPVFPDTAGRPPPTYPADDPKRKIDYILYDSTQVQPVGRDVACGAPAPPSDHCAVVAQLKLRPPTGTSPTIEKAPSLDSLLAK